MNLGIDVEDGITPLLEAMTLRADSMVAPIRAILDAEKSRAQELRAAGIPPPLSEATVEIASRRKTHVSGEVSAALAAATPELVGTTGILTVRGPEGTPGAKVQQMGIELGRMMIFGHAAPKSSLPARPYLYWHADTLAAHDNTILNHIVGNA